MNTLKFLLGMTVGSAIGYSAMVLKDKKVSFNVTVTDYDDDYDEFDEDDCGFDCECGNCMCQDECEAIDFELLYEDDYMQEGEVFDENGEPIEEAGDITE